MKQLTDEDLKNLVANCATADEFVTRASEFINLPKSKLYDIYADESYKIEVIKALDKRDDVILPLLRERLDCQKLWYECWIDLEEEWTNMWFSSLRLLDDASIVEVCAKYLNERARFYSSGEYYNMLNNLIKQI